MSHNDSSPPAAAVTRDAPVRKVKKLVPVAIGTVLLVVVVVAVALVWQRRQLQFAVREVESDPGRAFERFAGLVVDHLNVHTKDLLGKMADIRSLTNVDYDKTVIEQTPDWNEGTSIDPAFRYRIQKPDGVLPLAADLVILRKHESNLGKKQPDGSIAWRKVTYETPVRLRFVWAENRWDLRQVKDEEKNDSANRDLRIVLVNFIEDVPNPAPVGTRSRSTAIVDATSSKEPAPSPEAVAHSTPTAAPATPEATRAVEPSAAITASAPSTAPAPSDYQKAELARIGGAEQFVGTLLSAVEPLELIHQALTTGALTLEDFRELNEVAEKAYAALPPAPRGDQAMENLVGCLNNVIEAHKNCLLAWNSAAELHTAGRLADAQTMVKLRDENFVNARECWTAFIDAKSREEKTRDFWRKLPGSRAVLADSNAGAAAAPAAGLSAAEIIARFQCHNNGVDAVPATDDRIIKSNGGERPETYKAVGVPVARSLWGRRDVICLHPKSPEVAAVLDFSAITGQSAGTLNFAFHAFPTGDSEAVIKKAGTVVQTIAVAGTAWKSVGVPFSHEAVTLEVRATGWWNEHAFVTVDLAAPATSTPVAHDVAATAHPKSPPTAHSTKDAAPGGVAVQPAVAPTEELLRRSIKLVRRPRNQRPAQSPPSENVPSR